MRHAKKGRKFGRTASHRRAMFRNMATSLLLHEKCETTVHKAKDLRGVVEKLITLAGEDTLARRRRAYGYLMSKSVVHKLFADIGPHYRKRPGGYTRVVRTRYRAGDAAEMAVIELVDRAAGESSEKESSSGAKAKKPSRSKKAPQEAAVAAEAGE